MSLMLDRLRAIQAQKSATATPPPERPAAVSAPIGAPMPVRPAPVATPRPKPSPIKAPGPINARGPRSDMTPPPAPRIGRTPKPTEVEGPRRRESDEALKAAFLKRKGPTRCPTAVLGTLQGVTIDERDARAHRRRHEAQNDEWAWNKNARLGKASTNG